MAEEKSLDQVKVEVTTQLVEGHSFTFEEAADAVSEYSDDFFTTNDRSATELAKEIAEDEAE